MTIDERLEALTARHEALAQSMELTHHDIQQLLQTSQHLVETSKAHTGQLKTDADNIRALARIAEIHEHRLSHLEGPQ